MEKPPRYRFELLSAEHDVSEFRCANGFLGTFLQEQALIQTVNDLSRTYVLMDRSQIPADSIIGYVTLQADSFYDMEQRHGGGTIPVALLLYLARHQARCGEGIGSVLLVEAFRCTIEAANFIGVAGMHLAYTQEGKRLYDRFGFGDHPYGAYNLFLPIKEIRVFLRE